MASTIPNAVLNEFAARHDERPTPDDAVYRFGLPLHDGDKPVEQTGAVVAENTTWEYTTRQLLAEHEHRREARSHARSAEPAEQKGEGRK
jgi:hypothetical protein